MKQRVCWYNLTNLAKDERKLIYSKLDTLEWTIARIAHNNHLTHAECSYIGRVIVCTDGTYYNPHLLIQHSTYCARKGYLELLQWIGFKNLHSHDFELAVQYYPMGNIY